MAHTDGPCRRAKRCAKECGSALTMKLMPPWRYSVTSLWRWRATALKPSVSKTLPRATGSGAAYSTNSNPAVPMGFSQGWNAVFMRALRWVEKGGLEDAGLLTLGVGLSIKEMSARLSSPMLNITSIMQNTGLPSAPTLGGGRGFDRRKCHDTPAVLQSGIS